MTNIGPITEIVLDEIALEGLDGVTLDSLWLRLSTRLNFAHPLNANFCVQIWHFLRKNLSILCFELQESRPVIRIFNRRDYVESSGEQKESPFTIYKFNPITGENGLMGSCQDYATRMAIDRDTIKCLSLNEIEDRYGNRFILVGTQKLREKTILPDYLTSLTDVTPFLYSIVERIGRSRYNGEKSNGIFSLSELFESGKMHYIRKCLLKHKLIMRQPYYEKHGDHATPGFLLHLPRFFTEFKNKQMLLTEQIVSLLKTQPNCMAEYSKIKDSFDVAVYDSLRKLYKMPLFQRFIHTDVRVPYRKIYPNATEKEYKKKKVDEERILRVLQLRDPNIDVNNLWPHDYDREEDDDGQCSSGFLDDSKQLIDVPLLKQCLDAIKATRSTGLSQVELGKLLGLSKLNGRSIIKNLERLKQIASYNVDEGRQRVLKYVGVRYKDLNKRRLETAVAEIESDTSVSNRQSEPVQMNLTEHRNVKKEPELALSDGQNEEQPQDQLKSIITSSASSMSISLLPPADSAHATILCNIKQITVPPGVQNTKQISEKKYTIRIAKRLSFILRTVNEESVIKDIFFLKKMLMEEEKKLGYKDEMCKKSLYRLLARLSIDNRIKLFSVSLQLDNRRKDLLIVTDSTVDPFNSMKFSSIIEMAKAKFMVGIANVETKKTQIRKQIEKRQRMSDASAATPTTSTDETKIKLKSQISNGGLKYGYTPKFIRMRTLHEFLFYLIYEQRRTTEPVDTQLATNHWKQLEPLLQFDDDVPPVWSLEMGWKMFVPPLVQHSLEFSDGWALMTDVVNRLPLSLFVRIMNIYVEINGLNELLDDPVKKHYLLKHIPTDIQCKLVKNKKHIYMIDESMRQLSCIGLSQIGAQWQKEKEEVFIYLNRKASILNTTISQPGYAQISKKEYPKIKYNFNMPDDVIHYWHDLNRICLETPLGRRLRISEQRQPISNWQLKPELIKHLESRTKELILKLDNGHIPGDGYGAGGLDSSLFSHLLRNWSLTKKIVGKASIKTCKIKSMNGQRIQAVSMKKAKRRREIITKKTVKHQRSIIVPVKRIIKTAAIAQRRTIIRKSKPKTVYSEIDRLALSEMTKLRVDWSPEEDNIILFCKVAMMYICPNYRKQILSFTTVRDIIHWSLRSTNKTSKACQRRILYMMKKPATASSVHTCLQDIQHNIDITRKFQTDLYDQFKNHYSNDDDFARALKIIFVDLVYYLKKHFVSLTTSTIEYRETILPDTIEQFHRTFVQKPMIEYKEPNRLNYNKPTTKHDINVNTLHTLIHCSVCCAKDKTSWSIHFYDIYKDYPEIELAAAMNKIRNDHLISANKTVNSKFIRGGGVLPLSSNPYHLSVTYQNQLSMSTSYEIYQEMYEVFSQLMSTAPVSKMYLSPITSGRCFALSQLIVNGIADIHIELPKNVLVIDRTMNTNDDNLLERNRIHFRELFNIVPSLAESSRLSCESIGTGNSDNKKRATIDSSNKTTFDCTANSTERIMKLKDNQQHFFCLLANWGEVVEVNQLILLSETLCPFDCILAKPDSMAKIIDLIKSNATILRRLNPQSQIANLSKSTYTINDENISMIYSTMIASSFEGTEFELDSVLEIACDILDEEELNETHLNWLQDSRQQEDDENPKDDGLDTAEDIKRSYAFPSGEFIPERMHNFFYVNSCKIFFDYPNHSGSELTALDNRQLICLDLCKKEELVQKIPRDSLWHKKTTVTEDIPLQLNDEFASMAKYEKALEIYNFIKEKKELGAGNLDLDTKFNERTFIVKVVGMLCRHQLVLKTGIEDFRYVHWHFVKPWLISTYHLKRLTKESIEPNRYKLMDITTGSKRKQSEVDECDEIDEEHSTKSQRFQEDNMPKENVSKRIESSKRLKKIIIQTKDAERTTNESRNKFLLLIKPWIRVNGSLNRRVLDKWMGCILLHCQSNPFITGEALCNRFNVMQPANIRFLLEYLEYLGCVKLYVSQPAQISLWSAYKPAIKELATELDSIENIFVDTTIDATSKMAAFIGNQNYSVDFI